MLPDKSPASRFIVQPSSVHGQGVFANQNIVRAELISEYKGARVSWQDVLQGASSYGKTPGHTFLFDTGDGTVIDGASGGSTVRWMNHSCEPNCKAYISDGRVFIYTLRDIKRSEELTIDYGLVIEGPLTDEVRDLYRCHCGSPNCRGTMLLTERFQAA
ncbi:Nuclear protein SET (fragment) [Paraburkholderia piptadeniae]|uniref:Nuclear protein SET n=1 Tax=Paraburkholderia piptadeniae TaxID=1701573 RepID=A0A1N7S9A3_9BURK